MSFPEANSNRPGGQGTAGFQDLILMVSTSLWAPLKHKVPSTGGAHSYRKQGSTHKESSSFDSFFESPGEDF